MNKVIIIDGYSLLFRGYYATAYKGEDSILRTSTGVPVNAIFTFANMVLPIVNSLKKGDSIVVCLDTGKKTYRHELLDSYKGNRPPCPEPLKEQMPILREFLDAFSISHFEIDGFEADDVAGTIAYKMKDDNNVELFTSDKDYLQLVTNNVNVNLMRKGMKEIETVTVDNFYSLFNMNPDQIRDFKGLCGDSSDNLKGIPGIGEKTAISLIDKFGSLENIYERIDEVKGKMKEKLIDNEESGRLCKRLATINKNVDININKEDILFKGYDAIEIQKFIKKYEMKSLTSKVKSVREEVEELNRQIDIEYLEVERLPKIEETFMGFDIVVDDLKINYHKANVLGFTFFYDNKSIYISLKNAAKCPYFEEYLENPAIKKCVYSSKNIIYILNTLGYKINGIYLDLMLASYLVNSNKSDDIESTYRFYQKEINLDVDNLLKSLQISRISYELIEDANKLLENHNAFNLYIDVELPLARVLAEMEIEGFPVSIDVLNSLKEDYERNISTLTKQIYELAGEEFNISSPKQVADILFNKLGLKGNKKQSTSAEILNELIDSHPIVLLILEYRKYTKLLGTYIDGLISQIYDDDKLHCIFNQAITTTGRLSSSDPNMQNITVRDEEGKEIRKAFFYEKNGLYQLLSYDYSQIELRVLASLSNCKTLIDAFNNNVDIHELTAKSIFGVDEVTPLLRRKAKAVNFGIVYGISDYGLKEQLGCSLYEAKDIIERFYLTYPEIKSYLNECVAKAEETGYAETYFNRRRYLPLLYSKEYMKREFAKRAAMNAPIQGTAADIIKIVMVKINDLLKDYDSRLVLQIHDELIFKINVNEIDELLPKIKDVMENTVSLAVKLEIDGGVADNWYDVK